MATHVRHEPQRHRFSAVVDGVEAALDYEGPAQTLRLTHTRVPPSIRGRGVAGDLVRAALDHARLHGLKVVPACSYAAAFVKRHPQYADLLAD